MTYSCLIIDDEPLAHGVLKNHLALCPQVQPPVCFFNAPEAYAYLQRTPVDILFLDIQMPELTGLDFLKSLPRPPATIFTTAFRKYALDGFDLGVTDYLLKPIEFDRFERALQRAVDHVENRKKTERFDLEIKSGTQTVWLDFRQIDYAKGLKDYTLLFAGEKKYVVPGSLKKYEALLPATHFLRVHKSYLVAKNRIRSLHHQTVGWEGVKIPVGRHYKAAVERFVEEKKAGRF